MKAIALKPIRVGNETTPIGKEIKGLDEAEIKRLVLLGDATCDDIVIDDESDNSNEDLIAENEALKAENEALKAEIQELKNDSNNDETLTIEELRAKADELGIEYAQNIGAKKLAAKIAEVEEANK